MSEFSGQHSFEGRIVAITGGASGIGLTCAMLLAARGAKVVAIDLDGEKAEAAVAASGGRGYAVDVRDPSAVEQLVTRVEREIGAVDHLVTAAGIIPGPKSMPEQTDWDLWDSMFDVNVKGSFISCAYFGAAMAKRHRGSIVAIGSLAGMRSTPLHAYGPAKAAVLNMVSNLASQWSRSSVRVNAVSPGWVMTDTMKAAVDAGHRDVRALEEAAALGRLVRPDEIARTVAFLLSDEASAITGVNIPVECGATVAASWPVYGGVPAAAN